MPTFGFAILGIHAEQVACKQSRLITACTTSDFHDNIFAILRVGRNEEKLNFLLKFRNTFLIGIDFLSRHFLHVRVVLHAVEFLRLLQITYTSNVLLACIYYSLKVFVFLREFYVSFLVANHIRVGDERRNLLEAAHYAVKFIKYVAFCHNQLS